MASLQSLHRRTGRQKCIPDSCFDRWRLRSIPTTLSNFPIHLLLRQYIILHKIDYENIILYSSTNLYFRKRILLVLLHTRMKIRGFHQYTLPAHCLLEGYL